MPNTGLH